MIKDFLFCLNTYIHISLKLEVFILIKKLVQSKVTNKKLQILLFNGLKLYIIPLCLCCFIIGKIIYFNLRKELLIKFCIRN